MLVLVLLVDMHTVSLPLPFQSKQWVCDLKMNGSVKDIAFTADSRHMYSVGSELVVTPEHARVGTLYEAVYLRLWLDMS